MDKKILIIDDEQIIRFSLMEGLKDYNYNVEVAKDSKEALEKLISFRPDIILLDMKLKNEDGFSLAKEIKNIDDYVEIIIMTAYADIKTAIKAIKLGATDYLKKPLDIEEINLSLSKAMKNQAMKKKLMMYKQYNQNKDNTFLMKDPIMNDVIKKMNILAKNDSVTALITGETGCGKEVVANFIHNNSSRKDSLMLSINCASIPSNLLESELFGFEKNAFSGANKSKKGLLELAHKGTLFLDELGEIPLDIQAKLLRFLETKKFKRIGGLDSIEVDIRILAATNKNLEQAIKKNEFRSDLFYRLNVLNIKIPPLRKRKEDIIFLANHFLSLFSKKFKKNILGFDLEVEEIFLNYNWPGNVRELKNMIERLVILNDKKIITKDLIPFEIIDNNNFMILESKANDKKYKDLEEEIFLEQEVKNLEIHYIKEALRLSNNNYSNASKMLNISRHALKRRMEKYKLD